MASFTCYMARCDHFFLSQIGFLVGGWMDKHTEWGCHSFWSVCLMFAHNVQGTKQSQLYLCETSFAVLSHGTIFPLVIS